MKSPAVFIVYRDWGFRFRMPRWLLTIETKISVACHMANAPSGRKARAYVDIIPEHLIRG